eukprot:TRINITY_DN17763_c0_g1_i2.p1 TRINITY_DN17763_c0_g1~~TRINITY_DN17763_c0_g1_i2.p1  ORF type:complete len:245 (+),score=63.09 TRINITY_DN17763_c0_g1_i2:30-737(+)
MAEENYIGKLQEFCSKNKLPLPTYEDVEDSGPAHSKTFVQSCTIGDMQATGDSSPQKKASRQNAAKKLWEKKDDILAKKSEFMAMAAQNTKANESKQDPNQLSEEDSDLLGKMEDLTNFSIDTLDKKTAKKVAEFYKNLQDKAWEDIQNIDISNITGSVYSELESLGTKYGFEVKKFEYDDEGLDSEARFSCMIRVADMPANIAFAAASDRQKAEDDAARAALIYMKILTKKLKK